MKTTNYEISKKLKEIGFETKAEYYWHTINNKIELHHVAKEGFGDYKSYDLETLLDALPKHIPTIKNGFYQRFLFIQLADGPIKIGYYEPCYEYDSHYDMREDGFESCQEENESLADTAGRLLIKLHEAGIINFNK